MGNADHHNQRLEDIGIILRDLLKVIKVVSMYPEDNPLPQSLRQSFSDKLVSLVEQYGQIHLSVHRDVLKLGDDAVFEDRSKEESLAGLFFQAGISDFTLREGLEVDDIYRLLDAIRIHVTAQHQGQDLAATLWEASINGFSFSTVEDVPLSGYDDDFDVQQYLKSGAGDGQPDRQFDSGELETYESIFPSDDAEGATNEAAGEQTSAGGDVSGTGDGPEHGGSGGADPSRRAAFYGVTGDEPTPGGPAAAGADPERQRVVEAARAMGLDDLITTAPPPADTTIILNEETQFSDEEEQQIAQLVAADAEFDAYESTVEMLREMLLQEVEIAGFGETSTICEKVIGELLMHGRLLEAGQLLTHVRRLEERLREDKPRWAERLKNAILTVGSRDRLKTLLDALNANEGFEPSDLRHYLDNFGWESLNTIADLLGELENQHHRLAVCSFLADRGRQRPDIVGKGIFDKRWYVVRNSVLILGQIGSDKALTYLKEAIAHPDRRVRLEIVSALQKNTNDESLELLGSLAWDDDREIRHEVVRAILSRRGQPAFETIAGIIDNERFKKLDQADQRHLIHAYSKLGGQDALQLLTEMILRYNPLHNERLVFYRRAAFEALSVNRSEGSDDLLHKLRSSWRPDIRRHAVAAIQRRQEYLDGEE